MGPNRTDAATPGQLSMRPPKSSPSASVAPAHGCPSAGQPDPAIGQPNLDTVQPDLAGAPPKQPLEELAATTMKLCEGRHEEMGDGKEPRRRHPCSHRLLEACSGDGEVEGRRERGPAVGVEFPPEPPERGDAGASASATTYTLHCLAKKTLIFLFSLFLCSSG